MNLYICQDRHITATDQPQLLFCHTCLNPVEVVSDELPFDSNQNQKSMEPKRIQRKRTKGWRMPENTRCVNRGTKWGNPFKVLFESGYWVVRDQEGNYWGRLYTEKESAAQKAVECYSGWVDGQVLLKKLDLLELKDKNLACFCSLSSPCHADVLLEIANS